MPNIDSLITEVLAREGSEYTDRPFDYGGPTKYGITLATLNEYTGGQHTPADVAALTEDQAREIYRELFWSRPGFGCIVDDSLADLVFDSGVQHGVGRVIGWLQKILGLPVDEKSGPQTRSALAAASANPASMESLYRKLLARRISFYGAIISANPKEYVNAEGWANRVASYVLVCP